jgi:hypothetical protein
MEKNLGGMPTNFDWLFGRNNDVALANSGPLDPQNFPAPPQARVGAPLMPGAPAPLSYASQFPQGPGLPMNAPFQPGDPAPMNPMIAALLRRSRGVTTTY